MATLRRTPSYLALPGIQNDDSQHRTLRYYKDKRLRRKHSSSILDLSVFTPIPIPAPIPAPIPVPAVIRTPPIPRRATSPLAPPRASRPLPIPPRTPFPRSKPEPDLYRKAITTRMRCSPEGQKILLMGPRLALSILTATRELERIVAQQAEREDVVMADAGGPPSCAEAVVGPLTNSWVFVPGEDWEMVDCGA